MTLCHTLQIKENLFQYFLYNNYKYYSKILKIINTKSHGKNGCSNMGQSSYMFNFVISRCSTKISKILNFKYFNILH